MLIIISPKPSQLSLLCC